MIEFLQQDVVIVIFLENIIRDESTKIVKDEISEFLRREWNQKHRRINVDE